MPRISYSTHRTPRADGESAGAEVSAPVAQAVRQALGAEEGTMNALDLPLLLRLARDLPQDRAPLVELLRAINRHDAIRVRVD